MQVTETSSTGLKRELKVIIEQGELGQRFASRLDEVKDQVQLKGFRKGKVPLAHLKKLYGRSVMAEVLEKTVEETSRKALSDRNERPAHQPAINLTEDKEEIERVLEGKSDLAFTMAFEVLPQIAITDLTALKLEREVADVADEAIDKALADLVERADALRGRGRPRGRRRRPHDHRFRRQHRRRGVRGRQGRGRTTRGRPVQFIPGFVEGMIGAKAGEDRDVNVKFPDDYRRRRWPARTPCSRSRSKRSPSRSSRRSTTSSPRRWAPNRCPSCARWSEPGSPASTPTWRARSSSGRSSTRSTSRTSSRCRSRWWTGEFQGIWGQLEQNLKAEGKTLADEGKPEEELRADYRKIAERRVRLGLVIGEIGEKNSIQVNQDELRRALIEQARRYPGQERFVYEYYEKNPAALVELRAPLFEDKVVDYIADQAKPAVKKVSVEELLKRPRRG